MELVTIIDKAKQRGAVPAPSGSTVIEIRIDGTPSHLMTNAIVAFQGEIEDLLLRRSQIIAGGSGCLIVQFDAGALETDQQRWIDAFFRDQANLDYFRRRYGINSIELRQTPLYS